MFLFLSASNTLAKNNFVDDEILNQFDTYFVDSLIVYTIENPDLKKVYIYDEKGRRISDATFEFKDGTWFGKERYSCVYTDDKISSELWEEFIEGNWNGKERMTYVYVEGRKTNELQEEISGGKWVVKDLQIWEYNQNGKTIYYLHEIHNSPENISKTRMIWTYNGNSQLGSITYDRFKDNDWFNFANENYTYNKDGKTLLYTKDEFLDNVWKRIKNIEYIYNNDGILTYRNWEEWKWYDPIDAGVNDYYLNVDSMDTKGQKLLELIYYNSASNGESGSKVEYTHNDEDRIESITSSYFYSSSKGFVFDDRRSFTYDNSNIASLTTEKWQDSLWVPQTKKEMEYNAKNDTTVYINSVWSEGQWLYLTKISTEYNSKSKKTKELKEIWDDGWVQDEKTEWTYDNEGRKIKAEQSIMEDDSWKLNQAESWVFDEYGNITIYTKEGFLHWNWQVLYRETNTYAEINGKVLWTDSYFEQTTLDAPDMIFPKEEYHYSYNENGDIIHFESSYYTLPDEEHNHEGYWSHGTVEDRAYDEYGYMSENIFRLWTTGQEYEGHPKIWKTGYSYKYTHDEFGNLLSISSDDGDTNWVETELRFKDQAGYSYSFNAYKVEVYYTKVTDVKNDIDHSNDVYVYPNPATDYIEIKTDKIYCEIEVFDVLGIHYTNPKVFLIEEGLRLDISGLRPGVFFVRVGSEFLKFVKM